MVNRSTVSRRRHDRRRQSLCRRCLALIAAIALVVPPLLWEQITSIASYLRKPPVVSNGGVNRVKPVCPPKYLGGL